ncbi:MAG: hypothetical protein ACI8YQ_004482 [Polaribacter sp.]|jgi:hypothetical protein
MKHKIKKPKPQSSSNKEHKTRDGLRKRKLNPMPEEKFNWRVWEED